MAQRETYRIAVLGVGGVGGYFGGRLAAHYAGSGEAEIIFIARGANEQAIREHGLKLVTPEGETAARPSLVTSDAQAIGPVDVFVIATKAYDLEESVARYRNCIDERTAVLPLLNGVDHAERLEQILPEAEVWNGCAYIVARLASPGVVRIDSQIRLMQFGSRRGTREKLEKFESLLKAAGVDAQLSADIDRTVWEKFIFISALATATAYLDANIGEIRTSDDKRALLGALIGEVTAVARAKKINLAENIEALTLGRVDLAPAGSTSSMHSDFQKGGRTELESLTGYIVREALRLGVAAPNYEKLYEELKKRS